MSEHDPYKGHRDTGLTVSPHAVTPQRAMEYVLRRADEIAAGLTEGDTEVVRPETDTRIAPVIPLRGDVVLSPMAQAAESVRVLWDGTERGTEFVRAETDTEIVPVEGRGRRTRRRLMWMGGVSVLAAGLVAVALDVAPKAVRARDIGDAKELIARGDDPDFCRNKGGVEETAATRGTLNNGTPYVRDDDFLWEEYGHQGKLVDTANRFGLGSDRKLRICITSDRDDGERDVVWLWPNAGDQVELEEYIRNR